MTRKEEILDAKIDRGKHYGMNLFDVSDFNVTNSVLEAMDIHSRETSIAFAEWLKEETLDKDPVSGKWVTYDYDDKTSLELYDLFIQSQNK